MLWYLMFILKVKVSVYLCKIIYSEYYSLILPELGFPSIYKHKESQDYEQSVSVREVKRQCGDSWMLRLRSFDFVLWT